ncbi:DUF6869 domain-containing protein [Nitriliruptor alkaliphilus]|uniref:DUF6869 domain-containing protein n=1 Tax=Nitriliruptor alkaliphilus TaxID=427918 RepID=UPI000697E940|nr:hypothetical protein [Nitriliruptor alkaliphilus]
MQEDEGWGAGDLALYWRYVATFREAASRSERLWREASEVPIAAFLADQTSPSATPSEAVWETVMLLIETAPDDDALCWLGAGPVEDLAVHHGNAFIDQFVLAGRRDPRFRAALRCAWLDGASKQVRVALESLRSDR